MMGLDQNMMQKTLTCKNQWDAQKNSLTYSLILAITQFLFLGLGVLLYIYAENNGVQLPRAADGTLLDTDTLFPNLTLNYLGPLAGVSFLLGIIAASFSSVDSALTALTTSFTYDFLEIDKKEEGKVKSLKNKALVGFSAILFLIVMLFSGSRGDVISLVERAQQQFDEEEARKVQKKIAKNQFGFDDFLKQIQQIKKMGNVKDLMGMIPGMNKAMKNVDVDDDSFKGIEAIINSMTKFERRNPKSLNGSRRKRIALGSGTDITQVNQLIKQFSQMSKMMKMMQGGGAQKMMQMMQSRGGIPGMK